MILVAVCGLSKLNWPSLNFQLSLISVPEVAPSQLKVKVLDTVRSREADFVHKRPRISRGQIFVDPDFPSHVALGKYKQYSWKRPHVSLISSFMFWCACFAFR